jgi:hypothetical protein
MFQHWHYATGSLRSFFPCADVSEVSIVHVGAHNAYPKRGIPNMAICLKWKAEAPGLYAAILWTRLDGMEATLLHWLIKKVDSVDVWSADEIRPEE